METVTIRGAAFFIASDIADEDERDDIRERIVAAGGSVLSDRYTLADYIICDDVRALDDTTAAAIRAWEIPTMTSMELIAQARRQPSCPPTSPPPPPQPPLPSPPPLAVPVVHRAAFDFDSVRTQPQARSLTTQDKYAPTSCNEICGNILPMKALAKFLTEWETEHAKRVASRRRDAEEQQQRRRQQDDDEEEDELNDEGKKKQQRKKKTVVVKRKKTPPGAPHAFVLVGPPGIGKTTMVAVLARDAKYTIFECNASDVRTKDAVNEVMQRVVSSHAQFSDDGTLEVVRRCVVFEEIDGMSTSGMAAVLALIEQDAVPIVCVANDDQAAPIKRLKSSSLCKVMSVYPPTAAECMARLRKIARLEHISVSEDQLLSLATDAHGDMRHAIVTLGLLAATSSSSSEKDSLLASSEKDSLIASSSTDCASTSVFASTRLLFDPRRTFAERERVVTQSSSDLLPLFVHENYVNIERLSLDALARTADAIACADRYYDTMQSTLVPASYSLGKLSDVSFPSLLSRTAAVRKAETQAESLARTFHLGATAFAHERSLLAELTDSADSTMLAERLVEHDMEVDDYEALATLTRRKPLCTDTTTLKHEVEVLYTERTRQRMEEHAAAMNTTQFI